MGKLVRYFLLAAVFFLGGCQTGAETRNVNDENQREFILTKVNDLQGLIKLYREKLARKEDVKTRYSLAKYYHFTMDYESSRHYLLPLLTANPDDETLLLEGKNLLEQGHTCEALEQVKSALEINPNNGDALNIQGILLAQQGDYDAARLAFNKARIYYVDEEKVINNLAMLAIMQEKYTTARDYLAPLYARGYSSETLLHNLVFVLVKMQDFSSAEAILNREKNFDMSSDLLESLSHIKPRPQKQLQQSGLLNNQEASVKKHADNEVSSLVLKRSEEHQNEIIAIRTGQHEKYFRITMESKERINLKKLKCDDLNQMTYELSNVKASAEILRVGNNLTAGGYVKSISIVQKDKETILLNFSLKRNQSKVKIFYLPVEKMVPERLIFDVYYG